MDIIENLIKEGYELGVDNNNRIRYRLRDGIEPKKEKVVKLFTELKEHKAEAISFLKSARLDKGQDEGIYPGRDARTILVFSKVLNREVLVSWQGDNPETVCFDGIPYTIDEIDQLKKPPVTIGDLKLIHNIKCTFQPVGAWQ